MYGCIILDPSFSIHKICKRYLIKLSGNFLLQENNCAIVGIPTVESSHCVKLWNIIMNICSQCCGCARKKYGRMHQGSGHRGKVVSENNTTRTEHVNNKNGTDGIGDLKNSTQKDWINT